MNNLIKSLQSYLGQENPPKYLVIQAESPADGESLDRVGFKNQEGLWVISKEEAMSLFKNLIGYKEPFDWNTHWKKERERVF